MSLKSNDNSVPSFATTTTGNDFQLRDGMGKFPPCVADSGKVRMGGQGPVFRAADIKDMGKVRLGGQGPLFR